MNTEIFVNLPVKNLGQAVEFYKSLGFGINTRFSDGKTAACMIVSEGVYIMLLTHEKFQLFTPKKICDAAGSTEVMVCISRESRQQVDEMVGKAVAAGGTTFSEPVDLEFMYGHGFQDPDGHIWKLNCVFQTPVSHG